MKSPFEVLGLKDNATLEQVKDAWRSLAAIHHPDRGGDSAVFSNVRKAYVAASEAASLPVECDVCKGSGRIKKQKGFNVITVMCVLCQGSGTIPRG